jgi:hypothetical protein
MTRTEKVFFGIVHAGGLFVGVAGLLAAILLAAVVMSAALGAGPF